MRLDEWQRSENLVTAATRVLSDPTMRVMLDVLRNESPVNFALPDQGVQATDRIAYQSKTEGYHLALNNLEAFAMLKTDAPLIEATFEDETVNAGQPAL